MINDVFCANVATPIGEAWVAWGPQGALLLRPGGDAQAFEAAFEARFGNRPRRVGDVPPDIADALRHPGTTTSRGEPAAMPRVDLSSCGPFQRAVLGATSTIPPGEVRSYSWVASAIGRPRAMRAVGTALARNPVPLLVPCHRVVRTGGGYGNYAFGAAAKEALLAAERLATESRQLQGAR